MHGSVVLAHQLGAPLWFTVLVVLQIEECGVLLCIVCSPIVELDGLLFGPACKERGQLSEDFVSVVEGDYRIFCSSGGDLASSVLEMGRFFMEHFL